MVTWNSADELPGLLSSLDVHLRGDYEVVLVDNGSEDESVAVADAWGGPRRVLELGENRGFGPACNVGVREARHEVVVLLNPDARLPDPSLENLAELARVTGALCGPELVNADGSRQPSASALPGGWEVALDGLFPAALMPRPLRLRCEPWRARSRTEVGWLTGACIAAARAVLLELGPFDENLELYGEDLDLGLRARRAGVPSLYAPEVARVIHLGERSTGRRLGERRAERKLASRRQVVARQLGGRRERLDFAGQAAFHLTRFLAKRLLARAAEPERGR